MRQTCLIGGMGYSQICWVWASGLREPDLTVATRKNTGVNIKDVFTSKTKVEESDELRSIKKLNFSIDVCAREM